MTVTEIRQRSETVVLVEDEEDWDPDAWTPEKCWTEYWAPLGRAIRVVDPGVLTAMVAESAL